MSTLQAGRKYGVPSRTLYSRLKTQGILTVSEDDIAEVENENGLDDCEEEIAMGNKEIAERTGQSPPSPSLGSVLLV